MAETTNPQRPDGGHAATQMQQGGFSSREALLRRIDRDYSLHYTDGDQNERCTIVRAELKKAALLLVGLVPEGRELSAALTHIEQAMFIANAGISRNG